ncbi:hypothetical protein GCM10025867_16840 [Frondihabitans sucicola]|uniref:DUF2384 domain-containing protein n=1 Tax=Frondihabitans sucicola TaxID=1268041 RepID=A0ABM8GM02_9MICO|nr:hypothetical protein [Frondihabitans sucicola]BDZ49443.1 hypothetical protein GCM10025867_16840 [Frondihabitans sucicola]
MDQAAATETPADAVGPFIEPAALLHGFGCPRELLRRMTAAGVVLALPMRDGQVGYPAFQFDSNGEPLPGLARVLDALDPARSHTWRDAVWLASPNGALSGSTPAQSLRAGDVDAVLAVAAPLS